MALNTAVLKAFARAKAAQGGWFYNDPEFREAEARLRQQFGAALAEVRRRLAAAGVTDEQALTRAEAPIMLHFAGQFRGLYNAQLAREQARRERAREARRARRARILGAVLSIATRGLIQAGLNRQKYAHQRSLNEQRALLSGRESAALPPEAQAYYAGLGETEAEMD